VCSWDDNIAITEIGLKIHLFVLDWLWIIQCWYIVVGGGSVGDDNDHHEDETPCSITTYIH